MLQLLQAFQNAGFGNLFCAFASGVTPAVYSATAQAGPLLWNGSAVGGGRGVNAFLLAAGFGLTTAATAAAILGIAGNTGQAAAPTTTTGITVVNNLRLGSSAPQCNSYNAGTVTNGGNVFVPVGQIGTGAITVTDDSVEWVELGGGIIVPPGAWASVAASVTPTSAVMGIGLIWAEVPN